MAVTVIVAQYMLAFVLAGHSTEAALTELGTWSPLLGVLGLLAVQALGCVAIVRYFLVHAGPDFRAWATLIAPILGGLAMAGRRGHPAQAQPRRAVRRGRCGVRASDAL
jgi:hypothetical protein